MIQAFSLTEDRFYEDIEDIEEELDEYEIIYVGEKVIKSHKDFININMFIEDVQVRAADDSEYPEDYLEDITKVHANNIESLILEYMNKHIDQPRFYDVIHIREISVEEFKNTFCN